MGGSPDCGQAKGTALIFRSETWEGDCDARAITYWHIFFASPISPGSWEREKIVEKLRKVAEIVGKLQKIAETAAIVGKLQISIPPQKIPALSLCAFSTSPFHPTLYPPHSRKVRVFLLPTTSTPSDGLARETSNLLMLLLHITKRLYSFS